MSAGPASSDCIRGPRPYFALGKAAGLYGNSRGQIRLDDVWTLSDQSKPATMQSPESPDLLVAEFDPDEFTRICKERRYRDGKDDGVTIAQR